MSNWVKSTLLFATLCPTCLGKVSRALLTPSALPSIEGKSGKTTQEWPAEAVLSLQIPCPSENPTGKIIIAIVTIYGLRRIKSYIGLIQMT